MMPRSPISYMIDSHCHLLSERYTEEQPPLAPAQIIAEARAAGVAHVIGIACARREWEPNLSFAASTPHVSLAVGIHPYYVESGSFVTEAELLDLGTKPNVVAFGETGLDYSADNRAAKVAQHAGFHTHLQAARKVGIPVVIHTWEAEEDTLGILDEHPGVPFVLHSFAGSATMAQAAVKKEGYISFSGIFTFKNSQGLRDLANQLPRERILIETDAPYLAPEPFHGKRNAPSLLPHTAEILAGVWQVSPTEVSQITVQNTRRLFTRLPA